MDLLLTLLKVVGLQAVSSKRPELAVGYWWVLRSLPANLVAHLLWTHQTLVGGGGTSGQPGTHTHWLSSMFDSQGRICQPIQGISSLGLVPEWHSKWKWVAKRRFPVVCSCWSVSETNKSSSSWTLVAPKIDWLRMFSTDYQDISGLDCNRQIGQQWSQVGLSFISMGQSTWQEGCGEKFFFSRGIERSPYSVQDASNSFFCGNQFSSDVLVAILLGCGDEKWSCRDDFSYRYLRI